MSQLNDIVSIFRAVDLQPVCFLVPFCVLGSPNPFLQGGPKLQDG
jgi:hypothetical protein